MKRMFYMKIKTVKIMNCLCAEVTYLFWNEVKLIASIGHISIIRSFEGISAKNLFFPQKTSGKSHAAQSVSMSNSFVFDIG